MLHFRAEGLAEVPPFAQVHARLVGVQLRGVVGRDGGAAGEERSYARSERKDIQEHQPHQGEATENPEAERHARGLSRNIKCSDIPETVAFLFSNIYRFYIIVVM